MEKQQPSQPTEEQLERRAAADKLTEDIEDGKNVDIGRLDPRLTSIEASVLAGRKIRQKLGPLATRRVDAKAKL